MFYLNYTYLSIPPKMYEDICSFVLGKYAGHVLALVQRELEYVKGSKRSSDEWKLEKVEELSMLAHECVKHTDKAREYKTKSCKSFEVDLEGWDYRDQLSEELIHNRFWADTVKVQLHFKRHKTRGGVWKSYKGELQVDVPSKHLPYNIKSFQDNLFHLCRVVRHELGHMVQDFIGKGIGDKSRWAGIPSRNLRRKGVCPRGYKRSSFYKSRESHALRDVEFYTRLDDEIQKFCYNLRHTDDQETLRKAARLIVTGKSVDPEDKRNKLYKDYHALTNEQKNMHTYCDYSPRFFRELRHNQPLKYKEASRKFVKALVECDVLN